MAPYDPTDKLWPNKDEDMQVIISIMRSHADQNGQLKLILENVEFEGDQVSIQFPLWVREMMQYLTSKYGNDHAIFLVECVYQELGVMPKPHYC